MLYMSTKFREITLNGIKVIERTRFRGIKITKGNNHAENVGGVSVVNLCTIG